MNATMTPEDLQKEKDAQRLSERQRIIHQASEAMFERSMTAKAFVTAEGYFIAANSEFQNLVGWSEIELARRRWQDITHPEDLSDDAENVRRTVAGQMAGYKMVKRYLTKRGEVISIMLKVDPIRDENGRLICLFSQAVREGEQTELTSKLSDSEVSAVRILAWLRNNYHLMFWVVGGILAFLGYFAKELKNFTGK